MEIEMNLNPLFRKLASSIVLSAGLLVSLPSIAGSQAKTNPILGVPSSALEDFGGREGVRAWAESLFYYIMLDNRIAPIFREFGNAERQVFLNTQLEIMVLGGPDEYQGASMSAAHADLGITMLQFNAVVEDAYLACERNMIPYHACNHLVNALAPFTRDIVTK
jgi:hemoglobin